MAGRARKVMAPIDIAVADRQLLLRILILQQDRVRHLQTLINDQTAPQLDAEIPLQMPAEVGAVEVELAAWASKGVALSTGLVMSTGRCVACWILPGLERL